MPQDFIFFYYERNLLDFRIVGPEGDCNLFFLFNAKQVQKALSAAGGPWPVAGSARLAFHYPASPAAPRSPPQGMQINYLTMQLTLNLL